jgi:hypothetical protein
MAEQEQTYDEGRARNLEAMLRALDHAGELMQLTGDIRSELFHYEVRITYDTPEVAESRRIVREARESTEPAEQWPTSEWNPDEDESPEW